MRRRSIGRTLALMVMIARSAYAQGGQIASAYIDVKAGLSLNDAVTRAIRDEPSLRAVRAELEAARGLRLQSSLRPNPTFAIERREQPAGTDNQTMVNVEWPLDLFRRNARVAVADREVERSDRAVADGARLLAADVRLRYGQAAAAVRDLVVADDLAQSTRRELDVLERRVAEGASPPLERDLFQVEVLRLESERSMARGRADAAIFELKRLLGVAADARLMLRDSLETLVSADNQNVQDSQPRGPAIRSDVQGAEAQVHVAEARVARARSEGRPDVTLFGSYTRMDSSFPQTGFNQHGALEPVSGVFHYLGAGAMVTVPLRNRNQGEAAAAESERTAAAARLAAAQLRVQTELAAAAAQDTQARQALALFDTSVGLARRNLDVVRRTYELGRATISEVLGEQRRQLDVERGYTEALRFAYEARAALRRARGEL
jgi:cobalt-zinc-cadmium efflux system outer membrane protein